MSRRGTETPFEISYEGVLVSGTVIHGRFLDGYGPVAPEVLITKVMDEDVKAESDFETWLDLKGVAKRGREWRAMVAEIEEQAIEKVVPRRES